MILRTWSGSRVEFSVFDRSTWWIVPRWARGWAMYALSAPIVTLATMAWRIRERRRRRQLRGGR